MIQTVECVASTRLQNATRKGLENVRGDHPAAMLRRRTLMAAIRGSDFTMEARKVGPLEVSQMGFGTWSWGNRLLWDYREDMDPELQSVFNLAVSQGINLFDTADSYGEEIEANKTERCETGTGQLNGKSESLLGRFIREAPENRTVHIATKFAAYPWRVFPSNMVAACRGSLRRLEMETLSLGQLHWSTANYAPLQVRLGERMKRVRFY